MTIFDLECFIALAHCLNFTKASEYLNISQPAFSRHILSLESELSASLFFRNKRAVYLSKAGEYFLEEAEAIVEHYRSGVAKAQKAEKGMIGHIGIGVLREQSYHHMPEVIRFRSNHPRIDIEISEFPHSSLIAALQNYQIDIAFTIKAGICVIDDIACLRDMKFEHAAIMPLNHPLANRESIDPAELKNENFILFDPQTFSFINELTLQICHDSGFTPNTVATASSINGLLRLVECGNGIGIVPHHFKKQFLNNISYVKLIGDNLPVNERVMAWRKSNSNPCVPIFVREAQLIDEDHIV
jgi:DNA-binding transcriptional LysR family regulator